MKAHLIFCFAILILCGSARAERSAHVPCGELTDCKRMQDRLEKRIADLERDRRGVFARDTSVAALGDAWRDPDGTIWGEVLKKPDGTTITLTYNDALAQCSKMGLRLPTYAQVSAMRAFMGGKPDPNYAINQTRHFDYYREGEPFAGYSPQALPDLFALTWPRSDRCRSAGVDFWLQAYSEGSPVFSSKIGRVIKFGYNAAVRCVN